MKEAGKVSGEKLSIICFKPMQEGFQEVLGQTTPQS